MLKRNRGKKKPPKRALALPDLEHAKTAVLNSLTSASGQRTYEHAIREFVAWYCSEPRLAFNRTVVLRYRIHLEQRTMRQRPSICGSRRSDVSPMNPRVQLLLRLSDVALVAGLVPRIGLAQRHRPLRERAVHRVLGRRTELDPFIAETGLDTARDHRVEDATVGLVADAVQQFAPRAHVLDR